MAVSDEIRRGFASGATILTANVRAARWLRREYALEQRRNGRRAWASPPIEDWDTWVRSQWQEQALTNADAPILLTSLQERSVWTRMQRADAALLVSPARMAELAESAYALLSDYDAQSERSRTWGKTDAERFRQWAANFDKECPKRNWISGAGLESRVAASLDRNSLPAEILLVGFDRTTPAQARLLNALNDAGARISYAETSISDPQLEFVRAAGERDEITACAWWVRSSLEKDPETRIGVLVPDLGTKRSEIERVFRRVLMPQTDDIFAGRAMPFEFSLGIPLANVPVVKAALLLLRWVYAPLREEEVSWLLLSGFLSSTGTDYLTLARQDAKCRDSGSLSLEITLRDFLNRPETLRMASILKLKGAQRIVETNRIADDQRVPGRWVDLAQLLLREAEWPGASARDTLHFQALRRWERALDEIALLDFDGQRVGFGDFIDKLETHARETIFSAESLGAPVQIMGALEASGQQFDALWFLSADDESWPPRGRPHPLLPGELQRRFAMPYADAKSDLVLATNATHRITESARSVVFSHAERNKDGELRPSPLLPANAPWRKAQIPAAAIDHAAQPLEVIEDASGVIPWPGDHRSPGGHDVLKHQAACPFRAFGLKRLRAEALNRSDWGLSAAERGSILHNVLEKIWSPSEGALHSLDDLRAAIRDERLTGILSAAIARVFAKYDTVDDEWMRAYLASEQRRLRFRLEEWMREEERRVPFKVIACEEKLNDVHVGDLNLRLRVDRVDEVAGSEQLLIDYKSGEVSVRDWEPPRPTEPQLPLYAAFGNFANVRGVLFARIRAKEPSFSGRVEDVQAQLLPEAKSNSALAKEPYRDSMRDDWRDALLTLAAEFSCGEAAVDPKQGKKTCAYCELPGLCRVAELRGPLEENGAEENDNGE